MSVIIKSNSQDDLDCLSYYFVLQHTEKGEKKISIIVYETKKNKQISKLTILDPNYCFIDAIFDGHHFFIARKSNVIDAYALNGLLLWSIILPYDASSTADNVIFSINNYSDEYIVCALCDEIEDLNFISKSNGSINYTIKTGNAISDFFITNNIKIYASWASLYQFNYCGFFKLYEGDKLIKKIVYHRQGLLIACNNQIDYLYAGIVKKLFSITVGVIVDISSHDSEIAILVKNIEHGSYSLYILNFHSLTHKLISTFTSISLPFFLYNLRALIATDNSTEISPRMVTF